MSIARGLKRISKFYGRKLALSDWPKQVYLIAIFSFFYWLGYQSRSLDFATPETIERDFPRNISVSACFFIVLWTSRRMVRKRGKRIEIEV